MTSYRRISLTLSFCKVVISSNQFGFVAKTSTLLQLLQCVGDRMRAVDTGSQTDVVLLISRRPLIPSAMQNLRTNLNRMELRILFLLSFAIF